MATKRPLLVVAGATGFIGEKLVEAAIATGYRVVRLVRSHPAQQPEHCQDVLWDPAGHDLDERELAGAHAVVCLNGAPLIGKLWTASYKKLLWSSRIDSVNTLVDAIGRLAPHQRPQCFLSGSAIGYYSAKHSDEVLTEISPAGDGFLACLCQAWEEAGQRCQDDFGVRSIQLRTGLVMDAHGGMLGALQHLYRIGLGGPLSDGRNWMSTISLVDHVRAMLFCIACEKIRGPVNLTCPQPVRNKQWNSALRRYLNRPAFIRIPLALLAKTFPYAIGETLMASQRVVPVTLLNAGFVFSAPTVPEIFAQALPQAK